MLIRSKKKGVGKSTASRDIPLLLAYKAPHNTAVLYRTLTGGTWSAAAVVPGAATTVSPALLGTKLANTNPGTAGNIFFHIYS